MRQLLTAFGTNTPACWRAEDIDLVVETGRGCPFAWTMFQHPRHCASFRKLGESGLAAVVRGLIDLGQWSCNDFRSTAPCNCVQTSNVVVETHTPNGTPQVAAQATGTYAGQPINADFAGGALLSLRDAATPYPVDLRLKNGPTHATLVGSLQDPLNLAGADLKLELAGTNMELLLPLIGIAFPKTPSDQSKATSTTPMARSASATSPASWGRATCRGISRSIPGRNAQW